MAFTPLNALNGFLAVARRHNFAAAAADLEISPSALSQAVRQLEAKLGVTLLSRTTRSVALTAAGRRLFEQAGPAMGQALEALKNHVAITQDAVEANGSVSSTDEARALAGRSPRAPISLALRREIAANIDEGRRAAVGRDNSARAAHTATATTGLGATGSGGE